MKEEDVKGVIESIDMDDPEHLIFDSLKPEQVYELALKAERSARSFYQQAAAATEDKELTAFYLELGNMEKDHEEWLEKRLKELGPSEKAE
jgi:rubrerythrin